MTTVYSKSDCAKKRLAFSIYRRRAEFFVKLKTKAIFFIIPDETFVVGHTHCLKSHFKMSRRGRKKKL